MSLAAALLSLQTFQLLVQPYYFDEGGVVRGFLTAPHGGWFLWLAGMLIVTAASMEPGLTYPDGLLSRDAATMLPSGEIAASFAHPKQLIEQRTG